LKEHGAGITLKEIGLKTIEIVKLGIENGLLLIKKVLESDYVGLVIAGVVALGAAIAALITFVTV
jgi:hypothetical protein